MDRYFRNIFLWTLYLISGVMLCGSCDNAIREQREQISVIGVRGHTVDAERVEEIDNYPATVVPLNEIALMTGLEGIISDVYIEDLQEVQQGQRLYAIDRSRHQTAFEEAEIELERARVVQQEADEELRLYEIREEAGEAGAGQQAVTARSDLKKAIAQVEKAEEQLERAEANLQETVILAPFEGTIGASGLRVGSRVSAGQTLNILTSDELAAVDMVVKEPQIAKFDSLRHKTMEDSVFILLTENGMPYPYPGIIGTIEQSDNRIPGTIVIRLIFPDPEDVLIPGLRVRVHIRHEDLGEQIVIPEQAVRREDDEYYVYVVKDDTLQRRELRLGARARSLVVVREGLEEGETIVVEGGQGMREGSRVRLIPSPIGPPQEPEED